VPSRGPRPPALVLFRRIVLVCDLAAFDAVPERIFDGDPEFSPSDMTVVAPSAFGDLKVWHRQRR